MLSAVQIPHETSRLRIGMGTMVAVEALANTAEDAQRGIESAFAAVARVETLMHPTRSGSDLSAIHQARVGQPVTIHAWTWDVLALSRRLNGLSKGVFDPCVPESEGRIADLELTATHSVILRRPVRIDLGGIAKGFAVDRALDALRAAGCSGGLVNAGGDLAVFGGRTHTFAIRGRNGRVGVVDLKDAALAGSEVQAAARPPEHRGYYHGLTRRPIASGLTTVSAASAAVADALTKCLLADQETGAALLGLFDARLVIIA